MRTAESSRRSRAGRSAQNARALCIARHRAARLELKQRGQRQVAFYTLPAPIDRVVRAHRQAGRQQHGTA